MSFSVFRLRYAGRSDATPTRWLPALLLILFSTACQKTPVDDIQRVTPIPPDSGVEVMQVDFVSEPDNRRTSEWGRLHIVAEQLEASLDIEGGFLNVMSEKGWAVRNVPIPPPDQPPLSVYFDLAVPSPDQRVEEITLKVAVSEEPVGKPDEELADIEFTKYPVSVWLWNAQGIGPPVEPAPGPPPPTVPAGSAVPVGKETYAHYQQVVNVETAKNQCFPMSIANSLQFLENQGKLTVPHNHVIGLKGDNSLVGQLDTACDRTNATKRTLGQGVCFKPMVDGVFKYLKDNKLSTALSHRHQGRGWCKALPSGNYAKHGSASTDDGATPTWDWMCDRVQDGCGVEAVFRYSNNTGGHAVRVTGCGKAAGSEWIRYSHDALQTNDDPKDANGLEHVLVYPSDLNNDGFLNFDSQGRELEFVLAQCP